MRMHEMMNSLTLSGMVTINWVEVSVVVGGECNHDSVFHGKCI